MNATHTLSRPSAAAVVIPAVLATFIAIGLLSAVTGLFQRDGAPFGQLVVAERACANHAFVSERDLCVRSYLAGWRLQNLASR